MRFSFPKLVVVLSVAGVVGGLGASGLVTPRYVSTASLEMSYGPLAPVEGRVNLHDRLIQIEQEVLSRTRLAALLQSPRMQMDRMYQRELARMPIDEVAALMRRNISIRSASQTGDRVFFTIAFTYSDPVKAHDTVQLLMTTFVDANLASQAIALNIRRPYYRIDALAARVAELEKRLGVKSPPQPQKLDRLSGIYDLIDIDVLDPPSLPVKPVYPDRDEFMAIGLGAGFIAAILIAVFRRRPATARMVEQPA